MKRGDELFSRAQAFERMEIAITRVAPELVPALSWIVARCRRSKLDALKPRPPAEELAAVLLIGGSRIREVLSSTKKGAAIIERLPDISKTGGLLVVRASAAQRLGVGVESVLPIPGRRRW